MAATATTRQPLYDRVMDELMVELRRRYRPGELLPTQQELAHRFGTSLITVKRALFELGRMGLVESIRGRGTVVRRPTVVDPHTGVSSWTDAMRGMGGEPRTAWNRIDIEPGSDETRRLLRVNATSTLTVIRRLRTLDGEAACLMTNALDTARVPGLEVCGFEGESLYAVLQDRYGLGFGYADEEVTAREAEASERDAFGADCRVVVEVRRLSFDLEDRPAEYAVLVAPADRYTYRVRIQAKTTPPAPDDSA